MDKNECRQQLRGRLYYYNFNKINDPTHIIPHER